MFADGAKRKCTRLEVTRGHERFLERHRAGLPSVRESVRARCSTQPRPPTSTLDFRTRSCQRGFGDGVYTTGSTQSHGTRRRSREVASTTNKEAGRSGVPGVAGTSPVPLEPTGSAVAPLSEPLSERRAAGPPPRPQSSPLETHTS